jgi:hypothetical protein
MTTSVEFYRRLREHIPDEAARMIADELVPAEQTATKADLDRLYGLTKADLDRLYGLTKADLAAAENRLSREFHEGLIGMQRWMLTFFATQWLGTVGIIVAIFLKH